MIARVLCLLSCLFLASCAEDVLTTPKRKNLDSVFHGGQVEKYFLSDLPGWILFSEVGQCKKNYPVRYLHFGNVGNSYDMSYEELIQFQFGLNQKFQKYRKKNKESKILPKDQSFYFYNIYDQIRGGGRDFFVPKFNTIHVYWVDPALNNADIFFRLKKLLKSKTVDDGFPIFVSTCLIVSELEEFVAKNGWGNLGAKSLGQSMFSPFSKKLEKRPFFALNLSELMPNKKIKLFMPKEFQPKAFMGKYKLRKY
jgi:hypothetical protein